MHIAAAITGSLVIATILWDAFETIALPRTATRKLHLTRSLFAVTWRLWVAVAQLLRSDKSREKLLALYGPSSIFGLLAVWASGLIMGFALLLWSQNALGSSPPGDSSLFDLFYMSGSTLFGVRDAPAHNRIGRVLTVVEAGVGFALLTMVLSYLPVLYGSFSRRESRLTLLDVWGGSPPAATEILRRLKETGEREAVDQFLHEWEYWCAEVLESHISYPAVAYFRSQHPHQSWVSALATVLDVSALLKVDVDGGPTWRAHATFAIARHAAVDLAQILGAPVDPSIDRLSADELAAVSGDLSISLPTDAACELAELRHSYEPYVIALANRLMLPMPSWRHATVPRHNWQTDPSGDGGAHL